MNCFRTAVAMTILTTALGGAGTPLMAQAPVVTLTRLDCGTSAPPTDAGRAATIASLDRFKKLATNLSAMVIIQHDGRDVNKLPAFPAAAR